MAGCRHDVLFRQTQSLHPTPVPVAALVDDYGGSIDDSPRGPENDAHGSTNWVQPTRAAPWLALRRIGPTSLGLTANRTAAPCPTAPVWIAGVPYYYANDVYYRWAPEADGYEVVEPPAGADQPGVAPSQVAEDFFLYPKNGQTQEQQSAAKGQTGFDPTRPDGGVPSQEAVGKREQYRRAMTACLEARGYSVT